MRLTLARSNFGKLIERHPYKLKTREWMKVQYQAKVAFVDSAASLRD